jgi:hypothetical protein
LITRVIIVTPRYDHECRELMQRAINGEPTVNVIEDRRVGQRRKIATMMSGSDRRKSNRRGHQKSNTGTIAVFRGAAPTMPTSDLGVSDI